MTTQQPESLQLAFECEESAFHWVNEIDTRSKAAKLLRAQHARIAELEAALVKEAARTASEKRRADQMSQQHDMQAALNRDARERLAALKTAPQAVQAAAPDGWVPCVITYEGQHPEEIAYGPQAMMDRLKKWLDRYFEMRTAPAHPAEVVPAQGMEPIVKWQDRVGLMWDVHAFGKWLCRVVSPVNWDAHSVHTQLVQSGYAEHIDVRMVSAENAATQPASQGMDVVQAAKALCKHAAKVQNINFDDYWLIHAEDFKEEAQIVLDAAKAKQGEQA